MKTREFPVPILLAACILFVFACEPSAPRKTPPPKRAAAPTEEGVRQAIRERVALFDRGSWDAYLDYFDYPLAYVEVRGNEEVRVKHFDREGLRAYAEERSARLARRKAAEGTQYEHEIRNIKVFDDRAVAHLLVSYKEKGPDAEEHAMRRSETHLYRLKGGQWKVFFVYLDRYEK